MDLVTSHYQQTGNRQRKGDKMTITDLTTEQLIAIINWNENGNACWDGIEDMSEDDIRMGCLCTVENYLDDMSLVELLKGACAQAVNDYARLNARGIGSDTMETIKAI